MNFWLLLQTILNLALIASVIGLWIKLNRPAKDDPRLSKGLQLLQNKISVLEDLSDRTDTQVKQLMSLLEAKVRDVQLRVEASDRQLHKIDQAMQKSRDLAKLFQDRIPHEEIRERQNSVKYIQAAKLAHQGHTVEEIAKQVDLTRGEIEFIAKVNKEELMFCEEALPEWATEMISEANHDQVVESEEDEFKFIHPELETTLRRTPQVNLESAFSLPVQNQETLKKLGEDFKKVASEARGSQEFLDLTPGSSPLASSTSPQSKGTLDFVQGKGSQPSLENKIETTVTSSGKKAIVRPLQFPKIDLNQDLI